MKGIFLSLLSGSLFKLLQLENSFLLYASGVNFGGDNSSKSSCDLINHTPFFLPIKQNGTERNLLRALGDIAHSEKTDNKNLNLKYLNLQPSKPKSG